MKPTLIIIFVLLVIITIYLYRIVPWLRITLKKPDVVFVIGCSDEVIERIKGNFVNYELHVVKDIDDFYPYHKRLCLFIIELDKDKNYPLNIYDMFKKETKQKKRSPVLFIGSTVNQLQLEQWKYRGHDFIHIDNLDNNENFILCLEKLIGKRRPALKPQKGQIFFETYRINEELPRDSAYYCYRGTATEQNIPVQLYFLPAEYWAEEIKQRLRKIIDVGESDDFSLYTVLESQNNHHLRCFFLHKYEGITLSDYTRKKGNLSLLEAKTILSQIVKGLKMCHDIELYYATISPEHVFIPYERNTKIPDLKSVKLYGVEKWPKYKKIANAKLVNTSRIAKDSLKLEEYFLPEFLDDKPSLEHDLFQLGTMIIFMLKGAIEYSEACEQKIVNLKIAKESIDLIEKANSESDLEIVARKLMGEVSSELVNEEQPSEESNKKEFDERQYP